MSDREETRMFDGVGQMTSGQFLRIVRQNTIDKDKTNDDQWSAYYASSRMDGPALDWFEEQPEEIQESWKLLRRALLIRWPNSAQPGVVDSALGSILPGDSTIPTPAAAAPSAARARTAHSFKGRMRVIAPNGGNVGYLSKYLNENGDCIRTMAVESTQVVEFIPSDKPFEAYICDNSLRSTGSILGRTLSMRNGPSGSLARLELSATASGTVTSSSGSSGGSEVLK